MNPSLFVLNGKAQDFKLTVQPSPKPQTFWGRVSWQDGIAILEFIPLNAKQAEKLKLEESA